MVKNRAKKAAARAAAKAQNIRYPDALGTTAPNPFTGTLSLPFGKDMDGNPVTFTPLRDCHLLIGGHAGSGRSVTLHHLAEAAARRGALVHVSETQLNGSDFRDIEGLLTSLSATAAMTATVIDEIIVEMKRRVLLMGMHKVDRFDRLPAECNVPPIVVVIDSFPYLLPEHQKHLRTATERHENTVSAALIKNIATLARLGRPYGISVIIGSQTFPRASLAGIEGAEDLHHNLVSRLLLGRSPSHDRHLFLFDSDAVSHPFGGRTSGRGTYLRVNDKHPTLVTVDAPTDHGGGTQLPLFTGSGGYGSNENVRELAMRLSEELPDKLITIERPLNPDELADLQKSKTTGWEAAVQEMFRPDGKTIPADIRSKMSKSILRGQPPRASHQSWPLNVIETLPEELLELAGAGPGLVVIAGATGVGKTSTMAALSHRAASRGRLTAFISEVNEFPAPGRLAGVHHVLAEEDCAGHEAERLHDAGSEILVIDSCRNGETFAAAIRVASAGGQVVLGVHANGEFQATMDRLLGSLSPAQRRKALAALETVPITVVRQTLELEEGVPGRTARFTITHGNGEPA